MRRIVFFLTICLLVYSFDVNAQNRSTQLETEAFFEHIDLTGEYSLIRTINPNSYKGSPYYNTNYLLGSIFYNNELQEKNVGLRYNAFFDEIEFKENLSVTDEEHKVLVKTENLYVTINQELFIFKKSRGYFLVLFDGNTISLIKKISKKYYPPKKATTSLTKDFPAEFKDRFNYYIVTKKEGLQLLPNTKNKRLKFFNKDEKIKNYISKNKIDLFKDSDLEKLIKYSDNLKK